MTTPKQQKFVLEYVLTGNGVQSAITAGYAANSAHVEASRLLRNAKVVVAIDAERARMRAKADLRAEHVIAGLRQIAEDESAPHAARVSAWKALGNHLGLFQWNPVAEGVTAFLTYLADGGKPTVEAEVRHLELMGSSSA